MVKDTGQASLPGVEPEYEPRTPGGYALGEVASALQKAIRRGQEELAAWWALEMFKGGYWRYFFSRAYVIACEDIGLADPQAIVQVAALWQAAELAEKRKAKSVNALVVVQCAVYLARAPKEREMDDLWVLLEIQAKAGWRPEIPPEALDAHTDAGKDLLRVQAAASGRSFEALADEKFYTDGGLLYPWTGKDVYYRRLMRAKGMPACR
jgi:replication-associated recombination protein RarA